MALPECFYAHKHGFMCSIPCVREQRGTQAKSSVPNRQNNKLWSVFPRLHEQTAGCWGQIFPRQPTVLQPPRYGTESGWIPTSSGISLGSIYPLGYSQCESHKFFPTIYDFPVELCTLMIKYSHQHSLLGKFATVFQVSYSFEQIISNPSPSLA